MQLPPFEVFAVKLVKAVIWTAFAYGVLWLALWTAVTVVKQVSPSANPLRSETPARNIK